MFISVRIGFSFVRAAVACAILERTSGFELSFETMAPRSLFQASTLISVWMPLALLLLVSSFQHIFILYPVQVLSRPITKTSRSCSSSARASILLANRRLVMVLPPMLTFLSRSYRASDTILSRKMLKSVRERRHLCLTPTVVLHHSPVLPYI